MPMDNVYIAAPPSACNRSYKMRIKKQKNKRRKLAKTGKL